MVFDSPNAFKMRLKCAKTKKWLGKLNRKRFVTWTRGGVASKLLNPAFDDKMKEWLRERMWRRT